MTFRSLILIVFSLLFCETINAQYTAVGFKSDEYARFKASKTYYVKTGNTGFDTNLENAMNSTWKITPFSAITGDELKTKISDKSASFILLVQIGEDNNHSYHYLALINGGEKRLSNYGYSDMIAYAPINRWNDEPDLTSCAWRVRNMLEGMVKAMEIVQQQNIKGNSLDIVAKLRTYYNNKAPQIKKRTLLVSESSSGRKFNKSDVTGNYPFKVEVCDRSKIEKAIADKSTEYYYLQLASTLNKSWFVVDPSNGEILYSNFDIMGMNITKKDIKELVDYINNK